MTAARGLNLNLHSLLSPTHTFTSLSTSPLRTQIYLSLSHSATVNLSLEHHLFTSLPPSTYTLLLYLNTPSIIIGRNQNPWLETSHPRLLSSFSFSSSPPPPPVKLVRRRSGGGTVYHDLGNVNYSVTFPSAAFNRDRHAHMVAKVLGAQARVNERHDVVWGERGDKVSGSAYKLARLRSYHHGTMLLSSDLDAVRGLLRSPLREKGAVVAARGVESVRSPVVNTGVSVGDFIRGVVGEFSEMYEDEDEDEGVGLAVVSEDEVCRVKEISKGVEELESEEWTYRQTPRFTIALPEQKGEMVVEKGLVVGVTVAEPGVHVGDDVVGAKFGGEVVRRVLEAVGYGEAEKWAAEMVGGREWGTV